MHIYRDTRESGFSVSKNRRTIDALLSSTLRIFSAHFCHRVQLKLDKTEDIEAVCFVSVTREHDHKKVQMHKERLRKVRTPCKLLLWFILRVYLASSGVMITNIELEKAGQK